MKGIVLRRLASRSAVAGDALPPVQYWGRGYRPYLITADGSRKGEVIERLGNFKGYSSEQLAYLQKTIELAQAQDMKLILVMALIMPDVFDALTYYEEVERTTNEIAQKNGLDFIDFNRLIQNGTLVLPIDCFGDEHHVNDKGAHIVSTYLAEYINSKL